MLVMRRLRQVARSPPLAPANTWARRSLCAGLATGWAGGLVLATCAEAEESPLTAGAAAPSMPPSVDGDADGEDGAPTRQQGLREIPLLARIAKVFAIKKVALAKAKAAYAPHRPAPPRSSPRVDRRLLPVWMPHASRFLSLQGQLEYQIRRLLQ